MPSNRFAGGAVLSGAHDFNLIASQPAKEGSDELRVTLGYAGCDAIDCSRLSDGSAVRHVDSGDPPMFLANSTQALVPLDQAKGMAAALQEAGVRHELRVADGEDHAEFIAQNHPDIDAAIRSFLRSVVR